MRRDASDDLLKCVQIVYDSPVVTGTAIHGQKDSYSGGMAHRLGFAAHRTRVASTEEPLSDAVLVMHVPATQLQQYVVFLEVVQANVARELALERQARTAEHAQCKLPEPGRPLLSTVRRFSNRPPRGPRNGYTDGQEAREHGLDTQGARQRRKVAV